MSTLKKLFSPNKKIKCSDYTKSIFLILILFILIFYCFVPLKDSSIGPYVKKLDQTCLLNCDNNTVRDYVKFSRGDTYYLTDNTYDKFNTCAFNIWEFSHIIMHMFIGYWLDIRYSLGIGIAFETYEWYAYGCENYTDILWNTVGCTLGSYIRIKNEVV